jgi:hypothetical protein
MPYRNASEQIHLQLLSGYQAISSQAAYWCIWTGDESASHCLCTLFGACDQQGKLVS